MEKTSPYKMRPLTWVLLSFLLVLLLAFGVPYFVDIDRRVIEVVELYFQHC